MPIRPIGSVRRSIIRPTALAAASLTALLALQCGTAAAAPVQPTPVPAAAGAPAQRQVRITEGQVREVGRGGDILYPSVTSCLTVTVRLRDGGLVGAHASLFQVPGEYRSDQILPALRRQVGELRVTAVEVRGAVGAWDPSYLTKAIESYGPDENVPYPVKPDHGGIAEAVAHALGQPRAKVTVQDLPDGDITVR
ncbi:hypothetical protein [Kitasatospora sp. HPMI-4]|uniref:hypothetical protein n=1 Tax=Kitasatospora sp. HPMI-4 TaxID=3448443 RepID=UPI003F193549